MRFPNANSGVKKLFAAEIIQIVSAALLLLGLAGMLLGSAVVETGSEIAGGGTALLGLFFTLAASVLEIIAFFLGIIGVSNACRDEPTFKSARLWLIFGILASLLQGVFQPMNTTVASLMELLVNICEILSAYFAVSGVIRLAERLRDSRVAEMGVQVARLYAAIGLIGLLLNGIAAGLGMFSPGETAATAGSAAVILLGIAAGVCSVAAYILYLNLLSHAKEMLR